MNLPQCGLWRCEIVGPSSDSHGSAFRNWNTTFSTLVVFQLCNNHHQVNAVLIGVKRKITDVTKFSWNCGSHVTFDSYFWVRLRRFQDDWSDEHIRIYTYIEHTYTSLIDQPLLVVYLSLDIETGSWCVILFTLHSTYIWPVGNAPAVNGAWPPLTQLSRFNLLVDKTSTLTVS